MYQSLSTAESSLRLSYPYSASIIIHIHDVFSPRDDRVSPNK